mgnify:CR=1 FL=1
MAGDDDLPELKLLKRMKVAELRALLESRGLGTDGVKNDLLDRLEASRGAGGGNQGYMSFARAKVSLVGSEQIFF